MRVGQTHNPNPFIEVPQILIGNLMNLSFEQKIAGAILWAWSYLSPDISLVKVFVALMLCGLLDALAGTANSIKSGKFVLPDLMSRTIFKAIGYATLFFMAITLPKLLEDQQIISAVLSGLFYGYAVYAVLAEVSSIFRNLAGLGMPKAQKVAARLKIASDDFLKETLEQLQDDSPKPEKRRTKSP